jgi:hypothetical protein
MRIYAGTSAAGTSVKDEKKNLLKLLEPHYYETQHIHYIWTSNDLYQVENNRIYYVRQLKTREKTKTLLGAFPITIDHTEYIKEDECYQIPPKSRNEFLRHKVYKRTPTSLVEWIFVYEGEQLRENYFHVPKNTDINEPEIKADLLWGLCPPATQALTPALG